MKFSAQEEYGLRLILQIARAKPDMSRTIPELARLEDLSEPHVAKILMILRKAGFICSTRGQTGGYRLSRPAGEIVLGDVLRELGGKLYDEDFCARHSGLVAVCGHHDDCALQGLWNEVQQAVDGVLFQRTLQDVLSAESPKPLIQLQAAGDRGKLQHV